MRHQTARLSLLSGTALGAAMVWGMMEFVALQWSRIRGLGMFRQI